MNDALIKNYCVWARTELINGVGQRMLRYQIDSTAASGLTVVDGHALNPQEVEQRDELLRLVKEEGADHLRDRTAYTWFNRIAAVRYMELHDYLPSRTRMFTRPVAGGAGFELGSQAVDEALDVHIEGLDPARVIELKQAGDDKPLFRYLFLAQCDELSTCLPNVFQSLDSCMALLLPDALMEADGVIGRLVTDIPEEEWASVEILGWMYQFYNSEVKDAFFKAKRKAAAADIAPATQLFTPEWIVRYMVENSLGRLWMLNHPESGLREHMEYYIEPDAEHEDFLRVAAPEDITFCDPACGSGHILSYAFELLFYMYEEAGYREREIPELILTKNLSGMEIDERAAQIASLVLALRAREHDRRFFGRGVHANVCVLESIPFEEGELTCCGNPLAEALAHLGEVGSLLAPTEEDLANLRAELATCEGDLFANAKAEKINLAIQKCEQLARRFDVVVANPPYMGSSSFNPFMSAWVKKHYPDVKSDLFSSFIVRIMSFVKPSGESGIMCPFVWMFIGSYEKLRNLLIDQKTLTSLVQLEYSGFAGATVPICTFTFHNSKIDGYRGGYIRLSDFVGAAVQGPKALEAIKNPDCGYFYRADATTFHTIPGSPIAYWVSQSLLDAFSDGDSLGNSVRMPYGFKTGDNDTFLRLWWEPSFLDDCFNCSRHELALTNSKKWFAYNKGGQFRKWYGNNEYVLLYELGGKRVIGDAKTEGRNAADYAHDFLFQPTVTWSRISSGKLAMRFYPYGSINDMTGPGFFSGDETLCLLQALCNSRIIELISSALSPTLDFQPGQIATYPVIDVCAFRQQILETVEQTRALSKADWDSFETSWDFKRQPLL